MTRKLTLSADEEVIKQAKRLAAENRTTVSAMFARMIRAMASRQAGDIPIGPIASKATGLVKLPKGKTDRELITEALTDKYGRRR